MMARFEREGLAKEGGLRRVDVVFCLDSTASMGECIQALQEVIGDVAEIYSGFRIQSRFGLIEFRTRMRCDEASGSRLLDTRGEVARQGSRFDHPYLDRSRYEETPEGPILDTLLRHTFPQTHFTLEADSLREAVSSISAEGGGHFKESINDALSLAARSKWEDEAGTSRTIILITDSRPQEPDFEVDSSYDLEDIFTDRGIDQFYTISQTRHNEDYDPILSSRNRQNRDITAEFEPIEPMDVERIKEKFRAIAEHSGYSIQQTITRQV